MKKTISISKDANINYLAKIIKISKIRKHSNADKLQIVVVDFQDVITGLDAKEGDIYCFFPIECQINLDFLSHTNSFRHTNLNRIQDDSCPGFFEDNGRVRAIKLRGEKSMGYLVPIKTLEDFTGAELSEFVGEEFDTIGDILMVKKYLVKVREVGCYGKQGRKPRVSRLIDNQVRLHVDTENLRKNINKINPNDEITITYKTHGSSWWIANLLVKRKLNIFEKFLKLVGVKIDDKEYDYIYGSRKVVKNSDLEKPKNHFYKYDLWGEIKDELKEFIPKGYTLYGECLGYLKDGGAIQGGYDYGCGAGKKRLQIYRITFTNTDGIACDLSSLQVKEFCDRFGLEYVHTFFHGKAKDLYKFEVDDNWAENFMIGLERDYNDKDCFMCTNKVPEEGIVLRKETLFGFEAYKLKSFRFLELETKLLDKGEEDIESLN